MKKNKTIGVGLKKICFSCITFVVFFMIAAILSSCGNNTANDATTTSGSFSSIYTTTISTACINCHVTGGSSNGSQLDFSSKALAYSTLTTKHVTGGSSVGTCGSASIVLAGSPSTSYLAAVLVSGYSSSNFAGISGCQPYSTHLIDQNLSTAEKNSIIAWIQGGALNN